MARQPSTCAAPGRRHGFTLVEVLVALLILAVLAGLSWRGLDGLLRQRQAAQAALERTAQLQTALAQWALDLEQLQDGGVVPVLEADGLNLRLTRRHPQGLQVVVWSVADGAWSRWAAEPAADTQALRSAWDRATLLLRSQAPVAGRLRLVPDVAGWQLAFFRRNAWSNALSSNDREVPLPPAPSAAPPAANPAAPSNPAPPREEWPRAVRLQLDWQPGSGFQGPLVRQLLLPVNPAGAP